MVEGKFSTTNNIPINNWKIPLLLLVARMIIVDWCPISVSTQYCKTWQEVCFSIKSFQERICYNNILLTLADYSNKKYFHCVSIKLLRDDLLEAPVQFLGQVRGEIISLQDWLCWWRTLQSLLLQWLQGTSFTRTSQTKILVTTSLSSKQ